MEPQSAGTTAPATPAGGTKALASAWEASCPLSDKQVELVSELEGLLAERPWPAGLANGSAGPAPPLETAAQDERLSLFGLCSIQSVQEFYAFYHQIECNIEAERESRYRSYMRVLEHYNRSCQQLLDEVDDTIRFLHDLETDYALVSTKTGALHEACESLVREKDRLVSFANAIREKLAFFDDHDSISRTLNTPTLSVLSDSFLPMLEKLDKCVQYFTDHAQYKESEAFKMRFSQLQSRALTLVRNHTIGSIKTIASQIQSSLKDTPAVQESMEASLLYVKFQAIAPPLKTLMEELAKRASNQRDHPSHSMLLSECCSTFCQNRLQLLGTMIKGQYSALAQSNDLSSLSRAGTSYLSRLCQQEHTLFFHFFPACTIANDALKLLIEAICTILYDSLRPLFVREANIDSLCEVAEILKSEVHDHDQRKGDWLVAFRSVMNKMLQDVQERLTYRSQTFIRDEIKGFNPTPEHLNYPEKLQEISSALQGCDATTASQGLGTEAGVQPGTPYASVRSLYASWYPTLERTLMTLSKLYRTLDVYVFEGIAQEAVSVCTSSLSSAARVITKQKGVLDGHLFLIKHLLILREQITPFEIQFSWNEKTLDFSHIRDALGRVVRAGPQGLLALNSHNALLAFVTAVPPKVLESQVDSKKDLENELKSSCESFILHVTKIMIEPLLSYLTKVSAFVSVRAARSGTQSGSQSLIREQTFAHPDRVKEILASVNESLDQNLSPVLKKMSLYLNNPATRNILFRPVKTNIVEAFAQLARVLETEYSDADRQAIGPVSIEALSSRLDIDK